MCHQSWLGCNQRCPCRHRRLQEGHQFTWWSTLEKGDDSLTEAKSAFNSISSHPWNYADKLKNGTAVDKTVSLSSCETAVWSSTQLGRLRCRYSSKVLDVISLSGMGLLSWGRDVCTLWIEDTGDSRLRNVLVGKCAPGEGLVGLPLGTWEWFIMYFNKT